MFERFTETARQALVLAQDEARRLRHNYIGTEHILLGLLREEEGIAGRVLQHLEVDLETTRDQVARVVGRGDETTPTNVQLPFTPRAKRTLEFALREALQRNNNYVGSEHILLGVTRDSEGVGARILADHDVDADAVIAAIRTLFPKFDRTAHAYVPEQGRGAAEVWPRCRVCDRGVTVTGRVECLACLPADELDAVLGEMSRTGRVDARGVAITTVLMNEVLKRVRLRDGHLVLVSAQFDRAEFDDGINFERIVFEGATSFTGATFGTNVSFEGALFEGGTGVSFSGASFGSRASFAHVIFEGPVTFRGANFGSNATFAGSFFGREANFDDARLADRATFAGAHFGKWPSFRGAEFGVATVLAGAVFGRGARLIGSRFGDRTSFNGADIGEGCRFDDATFGRQVTFERTSFRGETRFIGARFGESVRFDNAIFAGDVSFSHAAFDADARLGPILATGVCSLEHVVSSGGLEVRIAAPSLRCSGLNALDGASLRLRYADVELDAAHFGGPSTVAGEPSSFQALPEERLREAAALDRVQDDHALPSVLVLSRSDVQHLVLANVDLQQCRFAGTHNLDQLVLEGVVVLARTPPGVFWGRVFPPVWRWTRRIALAEEHEWRARTPKGRGWQRLRPISRQTTPDEDAPAVERAVEELVDAAGEHEARHNLRIEPAALRAAATLVARYMGNRELPERVLDLIAATVARYSTQNPVPSRAGLLELEADIAEARQAKEEALEAQEFEAASSHRDRERKLIQERRARIWSPVDRGGAVAELVADIEAVTGQKERFIESQDFEAAARERDRERKLRAELRLLEDRFVSEDRVIGISQVAETFASWTGIANATLAAELESAQQTAELVPVPLVTEVEDRAPRPTGAAEIATVYRALRKGREDFKDTPGAADFYYGEMEMRRNAASARSSERLLLTLYWLASGYGLRASRPFSLFAALVVGAAVLFDLWGFAVDQSFADALTFSAESTIGLLRAPTRSLTLGGEWIRIVLRLVGPLLLGLGLFALRGRLKR